MCSVQRLWQRPVRRRKPRVQASFTSPPSSQGKRKRQGLKIRRVTSSARAEQKKILVVDDEPQIVEVIERYLVDEGFAVSRAYDGAQAVSQQVAEQPDLVLLDLKMPTMHGLDAFREIRARSNVPIIMLTSRSDEVDRIVGLELGADDYISKPFSPREVVARVKTVLRRAGEATSVSRPASVEAPSRAV